MKKSKEPLCCACRRKPAASFPLDDVLCRTCNAKLGNCDNQESINRTLCRIAWRNAQRTDRPPIAIYIGDERHQIEIPWSRVVAALDAAGFKAVRK